MLVGLLQFAAATAFSPRPAQCPVGEPIVGPCTVEPFECPVGELHVGCVLAPLSRTLTNVVPNVTIGSHTFSGNPCKNYPGYPRTRNPIHHYTNALTGSCELVDDLTDWEIPQTAIDVTKGTQVGAAARGAAARAAVARAAVARGGGSLGGERVA